MNFMNVWLDVQVDSEFAWQVLVVDLLVQRSVWSLAHSDSHYFFHREAQNILEPLAPKWQLMSFYVHIWFTGTNIDQPQISICSHALRKSTDQSTTSKQPHQPISIVLSLSVPTFCSDVIRWITPVSCNFRPSTKKGREREVASGTPFAQPKQHLCIIPQLYVQSTLNHALFAANTAARGKSSFGL